MPKQPAATDIAGPSVFELVAIAASITTPAPAMPHVVA